MFFISAIDDGFNNLVYFDNATPNINPNDDTTNKRIPNLMIKNILILLSFLLLSQHALFAQTCLSSGISFCTQQEIDNFSINYPNCTEILGNVFINGTSTSCLNNISDLSGLSQLNAVGGLNIDFNTNLTDLSGLENLSEVNGNLLIWDNTMLTSIEGLLNLKKVNGFVFIGYNNILTNINGLQKLDSINGHLEISNNPKLESISAIENLNPNTIESSSISEDLQIFNNPMLSYCHLDNICQFLYFPGSTVKITNNLAGCGSEEEIKTFCPPPSCANILSPTNGAINVPTNTSISWETLENATGYKVSIGTVPGTNDILDDFDVGLSNLLEVDSLPCATTLYTIVTPYNVSGNAINCNQVVFTTEIVDAIAGSDIVLCKGDTIQLSATNSIGTHFEWSPSEFISNSEIPNPFAFPLDTTVYYLNVSNEGRCQNVDSLVVYVRSHPMISTLTTDETGQGLNNGTATVVIDGVDSLYAVLWSNGEMTLTISNLVPDEYSVIVKDTFNCLSHDTVTINQYILIDSDMDGYTEDIDCNDNNPNINPGQTEVPYNGLDDDCNPATLDDDLDQDGFLLANDCDDNNSNINPDQAEVPYNGIDDDCNSSTLDDDLDQDGFLLANDCDDNNSNINPDQGEVPYNGIDDDCNSSTLDDDLDQDGFLLANDCDDENPNINPDQDEVPYNGIDDDCNSSTLDDDLDQDGFLLANDCDDENPNINPDQAEVPYNGIDDDCNSATLDDDLDQDGFLLANDCDDENPNINPDQDEVPYNGIDDDCNSATLDDDLDQDGFLLANDCDDENPNINPNAVDIPNNGIDEDCDGMDTVTSTHELANTTINIYPNPAINIINIETDGQLNFEANLYNLDGKLILSDSNTSLLKINSIPKGTYLLEIKDLKTGQKIIEKIIKGN